jgi:hypothetical protein
MERCTDCPVAEGRACIAAALPESFGHFCGWAKDGEPTRRAHVVNRSAIAEANPPAVPMPGLARQAVNFVGAVAHHVAAGMPSAPAEVKAARLAICRECDLYVPETARCRDVRCGWADMSCPLDPPRWGPVTSPTAP